MNDTDRSLEPEDIPDPDAPDPDAPRNRFEKLAATIGDLDSPFYDEERDRDVWNEASAVGFQAMLWGLPLTAAASLWLGGGGALPYATAMLVPWLLGAAIALVYARRRAVEPGHLEALTSARVRLWWFAALMAALSGGYLWAARDLGSASNLESFVRGAAQGGAVAALAVTVVVTVLAVREARRRDAAHR